MKRLALAATAALLLPTLTCAAPAAPAQAPAASEAAAKPADGFQTDEQRTLYALGMWLSSRVDVFNLTAGDLQFVEMGLKDGAAREKSKVEMEVWGPKINDLAQARIKATAEKEKQKSKEFLAKAAKEKGAKAFPSGLIYLELKRGKGAAPGAADTVKAHYKGTLLDGTVFDASAKHGAEPLEFQLNGVIPCWTEGIQKMKVGGKAKLICPADIAYGDVPKGPIPAGSTLVFEVELVDVVKAPPQEKEAKEAKSK